MTDRCWVYGAADCATDARLRYRSNWIRSRRLHWHVFFTTIGIFLCLLSCPSAMAEPRERNVLALLSSEPNGWKYFIASITVMLVQALLIVALFRQRSRKRKAETALANSEEK